MSRKDPPREPAPRPTTPARGTTPATPSGSAAPPRCDYRTTCPNCGAGMFDRGCKTRCPRCHYFTDCSDPW